MVYSEQALGAIRQALRRNRRLNRPAAPPSPAIRRIRRPIATDATDEDGGPNGTGDAIAPHDGQVGQAARRAAPGASLGPQLLDGDIDYRIQGLETGTFVSFAEKIVGTFEKLVPDPAIQKYLLGIPVTSEKLEGPTTTLTFLGIVLNTSAQQLYLPLDKLTRLSRSWLSTHKATKRELLLLIGQLFFAAKVVPAGRRFLYHLIDLSTTVRKLHHHVSLNAEAKADIRWRTPIPPRLEPSSPVATDTALASSTATIYVTGVSPPQPVPEPQDPTGVCGCSLLPAPLTRVQEPCFLEPNAETCHLGSPSPPDALSSQAYTTATDSGNAGSHAAGSMTDQMDKGTTICIGCTEGRRTCPVAAMEAYRECCRFSTHSTPTEMEGHSHPRASTLPSYPWWINVAMMQPNTTPTVYVLVQPQQPPERAFPLTPSEGRKMAKQSLPDIYASSPDPPIRHQNYGYAVMINQFYPCHVPLYPNLKPYPTCQPFRGFSLGRHPLGFYPGTATKP
eukprot:Em0011g916a